MPKYRGRVDCYLNPTSDSQSARSRASGEAFVNIIQHISSSMTDLGIEMIASNYGTGSTGWNFHDEAGATGLNAFACFRFHSASLGKFDCLLYSVTGSGVNTTSPVRIDGYTDSNYYGGGRNLGIAFAVHPSGSTMTSTTGPWNGTVDSMGPGAADVANPLWQISGSYGAFFPRNNDLLGSYSGSRGNLMGVLGDGELPMRLHTIVSEDSLTIISDGSNNGDCKIVHFGSYIPRSGSTPVPQSPYFLISNGYDSNAPLQFYTSTYPDDYGANENTWNGGVAHPNLMSGSKFATLVGVGVNQTIGYNSFINSGSFEKFPIWIGMYEATDIGILGLAKHISYGVGMVNYSVSELSSSAAFGRMTQSEVKFLVPWQGDAPNTSPTIRTGRTFSFNT